MFIQNQQAAPANIHLHCSALHQKHYSSMQQQIKHTAAREQHTAAAAKVN
jgi:hypothetical protein